MAKVLLKTVPKKGSESYSKEFDSELAEKVLRKSKNWELPGDSKHEFKDGVLTLKGKQPDKKSD